MKKTLRLTTYDLRLKLVLLTTYYLLLTTALCGCQRPLYKESRAMMGTFVEVASPHQEAAGIVFEEIERIENLLSKYRPDSEVSRLNKRGRLKVSPETLYLLKKAGDFWSDSEGAFDITAGPLSDLWGFTDKKYDLPADEQVQTTLSRVGFDKIIFHQSNNMVEFNVQGMKIDLGGIAKGYAVDSAVKKLKEKGIKDCLINAGGDIYCLGNNGYMPWKVAIKDAQGGGVLDSYLELKDKAVATSGDYEQYFIKGEGRYSHIFNPKTGYPADSGVASVTVIASSCLVADTLATTIFVLGKEKGEKLAGKFPDAEVRIIEE